MIEGILVLIAARPVLLKLLAAAGTGTRRRKTYAEVWLPGRGLTDTQICILYNM